MESYNSPHRSGKLVVLDENGLSSLLSEILPPLVNEGIKTFKEKELQEKLLSPEEACKLFLPAISRPTLESYSEKGYFTKYYLEGRTWFKYSEVMSALKNIKRYSRKESSEK